VGTGVRGGRAPAGRSGGALNLSRCVRALAAAERPGGAHSSPAPVAARAAGVSGWWSGAWSSDPALTTLLVAVCSAAWRSSCSHVLGASGPVFCRVAIDGPSGVPGTSRTGGAARSRALKSGGRRASSTAAAVDGCAQPSTQSAPKLAISALSPLQNGSRSQLTLQPAAARPSCGAAPRGPADCSQLEGQRRCLGPVTIGVALDDR
jgi:hypothetical protein